MADVTGNANADLTVSTVLVNQSGDFNDPQYSLNPTANDRTARLTKTGAGTMVLSAATNTYTGATTINGGTLALQTTTSSNIANTTAINVGSGATLDVTGVTGAGGFALSGTQTLTNNGTVAGDVAVGGTTTVKGTGSYTGAVNLSGGTIAPGTVAPGNLIGTVTVNGLTASAGTLALDIGGATSDVVNVTNAATFTGGTINITLTGIATQASYDVLTSSTLSGAPTLGTTQIGRTSFALSTVGNALRINVTGKGANVTFSGAAGTGWDNIQTSANWTTADAGIVDTTHFYDGDVVTFNDNNGGQYNVNIGTTVTPSAGVTVNNNNGDYVVGATSDSGLIAGPGSLIKTGTRALTLGTANTYAGGTTLSQGRLNINNASGIGTGPLTIAAGTTLGNTSGGAIVLSTNNPQAWNGSFTFAGTSDGLSDLSMGSGAITLNSNPTVTLGGGTLTLSGAIGDGTGNSLTFSGSGTVVLNGPNTYTGTTTVNSGVTVRLGNTSTAFGSNTGGSVTISAGATLDLSGTSGNNQTLAGFVNKQFFIAGDGVGGVGAITDSNAASNQQNMFQKVTLTADASFGGTQRFDIRGFNGLSSANNNLATLDLAGHTLTNNNTNFIGLVGVEVTDGSIVTKAGNLDFEGSTNIRDFGSGQKITIDTGALASFFDFRGTFTRPIVMNDGARLATNGGGIDQVVVGSNISLNGNVSFGAINGNGGGILTLNGVISETGGSRGITKIFNGTGNSTVILGASNTFTGGLTINGGVVQLNNPGALNSTTPNSVTLTSSGTAGQPAPRLRLNGNSVTIGALNSTGGAGANPALVENNSATAASTLTVNIASNPIFDGILQNGDAAALSLATTGAGTFTLTGANTYTGSTTVGAGGTLQVGNGGATGAISGSSGISGPIGTTLGINRTADLTIAAPITGGIAVNKDGSNTLTLSGTSTSTGPINVNAGTLIVTGALGGSATVTLNTGSTPALSGTGDGIATGKVGNVIMNSGTSIQPGATTAIGSNGTLTLNSLTVAGGDYKVDVGSPGSGDLVNVSGLAHYTGPSTISPNAAVATAGSPYTVLTAGTLTIDAGATPTVNQISGARVSFSLNLSTPNTIKLNVVGSVGNLLWKGNVNSGGAFLWDVNTTSNWTNSAITSPINSSTRTM